MKREPFVGQVVEIDTDSTLNGDCGVIHALAKVGDQVLVDVRFKDGIITTFYDSELCYYDDKETSFEDWAADPVRVSRDAAERQDTELGRMERDAERWRALLKSGRIRILGAAGFHTSSIPKEEHYRHVGLELWTRYDDAPNEPLDAEKYLVEFADEMREVLRT